MSFGAKKKEPWKEYERMNKAMGCIVTKADNIYVVVYHHVKGLSWIEDKQHVGPWLGFPLYQPLWGYHPNNMHKYGKNAIHTDKGAFEAFAEATEYELCNRQIHKFIDHYELICSPDPDHNCPFTYLEYLAMMGLLK